MTYLSLAIILQCQDGPSMMLSAKEYPQVCSKIFKQYGMIYSRVFEQGKCSRKKQYCTCTEICILGCCSKTLTHSVLRQNLHKS